MSNIIYKELQSYKSRKFLNIFKINIYKKRLHKILHCIHLLILMKIIRRNDPFLVFSKKRLRRILRGAHLLMKSNDPLLVYRIKAELTVKKLNINTAHVSRYIFGEDSLNIELITRQYLLSTIAFIPMNKSILFSLGSGYSKLKHPLPDDWIITFKDHNLKVNTFISKILFKLTTLKYFLVSIITILSIIKNSIISTKANNKSPSGRFVRFNNLLPHCIPRMKSSESYDIITWYINWIGKIQGLEEIHYNIPVSDRMYQGILLRYSPDLPGLCGFKNKLNFMTWALFSISISLVGFARGRWVNCLLLGEAARAKQIKMADPKLIAQEYLFNIGNHTYRPLWTYAAERRGSIITMYNYAASFSLFRTKNGYPPDELGYRSMSWPRILHWSKPYAEYTQSALLNNNVKVELVPPVYYCDSDVEIPSSKKPVISVFDITPIRTSRASMFCTALEYRSYLIGKQFLEDIYDCVISNGYNLMWKRKRKFGYYNSSFV